MPDNSGDVEAKRPTHPRHLIAIPCYNEEQNLPSVLDDLASTDLPEWRELLVVNDGSIDDTRSIIARAGLASIAHEARRGYGASVKTAVRYASTRGIPAVTIFPGDGQRSRADLDLLIASWESGTSLDLIVGSKLHRGVQVPLGRRTYNQLLSWCARVLCGAPYRDVLSGFKSYRVDAWLPVLDLLPDDYSFDVCVAIVCARNRFKTEEWEVGVRYHSHSTSMRAPTVTGIRIALQALRYSWALRRTQLTIRCGAWTSEG